MRVVALTADSVVVAEGKLFVQGGGWDQINALGLPTRHPRIGIGVLIRVPYTETNIQHAFDLRLEDPDGKEVPLGDAPPGATKDGKVRRVGGQFTVGRPPMLGAGDEQVVPIAVNLDGLTFTAIGTHRIVLAVDGKDVETIPFRLNVAFPAQAGPIIR
jgi:hypothetical protein